VTSSRRFSPIALGTLGTLGALLALGSAPAHGGSGPADFDFNLGHWKSRIHSVLHPLSATPESNDMTGAVSVRKLWDGGLLEEIEADGAKGHWEGLTIFLYNPTARQWSQFFANSKRGVLGQPPLVGDPTGGRIEMYSSDTVDGRTILVRSVWSQLKRDSHRYDEHHSDDGGKSWKLAFGVDLARSPTPAAAPSIDSAPPGEVSHEFDFELGKWKLETRRMTHPLTHSNEWTERVGQMEAVPLWGGKANLAHLNAEGPTGRVEMAALRLYNPKAKQWSIYFATPQAGMLGLPLVGEFKGGRGEFYDQEEFNGRTIWVRISIFPTSPTTTQTEQAFSDDQGKTWETNMVTRFTRIPG
jgi:hypothetical protein